MNLGSQVSRSDHLLRRYMEKEALPMRDCHQVLKSNHSGTPRVLLKAANLLDLSACGVSEMFTVTVTQDSPFRRGISGNLTPESFLLWAFKTVRRRVVPTPTPIASLQEGKEDGKWVLREPQALQWAVPTVVSLFLPNLMESSCVQFYGRGKLQFRE